MKRIIFLALVTPMVFLILSGCFSNQASNEWSDLQEQIEKEMGVEVIVPEFPELEIANSFIYFKHEEPNYVTMQYTSNRADINEYFKNEDNTLNEERLKQYEEDMSSKFLYGPYEGEVHVMITFRKGSNMSEGQPMEIEGVPVLATENNFGPSFIVESEQGHYTLDYQSDAYTEEEAKEHLRHFINLLDQ